MRNRTGSILTEGNIHRTLIKLSLQMFVGIIAMQAFNLIDTFFVGQLGADELAAMGFTFPVVLVINSLTLGLGIGTSSVVSRAIGEGNSTKVRHFTTDSLILALMIVTIFVFIGMATITPLFRALGAKGNILSLIKSYMRIWYFGMPFVVVPMVGNNAIRATGDTKTPSMIMLCAVGVNLLLDPLLIFGPGPLPRWELAGAAAATVIARSITMLLSLWVLYHREKMITFEFPGLQELFQSWKKILYIGLPAGGTNLIMPISMGIVTRLVAMYGAPAVAGFGVGSRIQMFSMSVIISLGAVLIPFVGQNWGAKKIVRIRNGINFSYKASAVWGGFLFVLFWLTAAPIARLFNTNPSIVHTTTIYLKIVSFSFSGLGIMMLSAGVFNALNKPVPASALMLIRMFALYIPLAFLGSHFFALTGIFSAAVAANFISAGLAYVWIKRELKKHSS